MNEGFEFGGSSQFIDKKQIALRPSISDAVQQHVHHHYHHGESTTNSGGPSFIPIGQGASSHGYGASYGNIGTSYDIPNSGLLGGGFQDLEDYKKAFKVKGTGNDANGSSGSSISANSYAGQYPLYEKPTRDFAYAKADGHKGSKYLAGSNFASTNAVHSSSNDYIASGTTNSQYYGNGDNDGFRNDFSADYSGDCLCVPYAQCPSEHAGRKDDLFLPIDPRHLNKNIESEAIAEGTATTGNETSAMSRAGKSEQVENEGESKGRKKREAPSGESESIEGRKKSNGEGVRILESRYLFGRCKSVDKRKK